MSREAAGYKPGSSSLERIFNYRVSRARWIIKNIFGILSLKFRVLLKMIALYPDKVESVVLSCIYLYNFLHRNAISKGFYTPPGSFDSEDSDGNLIPGLCRSDVDDRPSLISLQNIPKQRQVKYRKFEWIPWLFFFCWMCSSVAILSKLKGKNWHVNMELLYKYLFCQRHKNMS
jgi:hypothetical protein